MFHLTISFSNNAQIQQASSQSQPNNQSGDELHYAELAISRTGATSSKQSSSTVAAAAGSSAVTASTSSSGVTATGNYDIKFADGKNQLPNKPPAYDYFKEPTVYAQIDHFKTMQHKSHTPSSAAVAMSNSASASNAYQMHHQNLVAHPNNQYYQQQQQQQAQPHSQLQYGSDSNYSMRNISNNGSTGSGIGHPLNNSGSNGTLSNSNTLTFSNQSIQSPSSSSTVYHSGNPAAQSQQQMPLTNNTSKQYSREIVTIRTPLLCSQQESCV